MILKIMGERNSGTNLLLNLLSTNLGVRVIDQIYLTKEDIMFWKHDISDYDDMFSYFGEDVITVCVFRKLDDWLISMYNNPHELEKKYNFHEFLTGKQIVKTKEIDYKTKKEVNYNDNMKNIFEIRYDKIKKMLNYCSNNTSVMVSYEYLIDNQESFVREIVDAFNIPSNSDEIVSITSNVKHKNRKKDFMYSENFTSSMYKSYINNDIEEMINNLKIKIR